MKEPVIVVKGLGHEYMAGTPLAQASLRGVDLAVDRGEIAVIAGASGSGKTTLLQHLNGLLPPQQGEVTVLGRNLGGRGSDLTAMRRKVGLVFQRPEIQLFEAYVGDDVAYGPRQIGLRGRMLADRVQWAMETVGLDFIRFKDRLAATLSGGERRKAALAGVIALQPDILVLDEPTAGLDPVSREELLRLLERLRGEGSTVVIATHDMEDAAALADSVTVLAGGRVAAAGSAREILSCAAQLKELDLAPPAAASLMTALRARGWPVPEKVVRAEEAVEAISRILAAGGAG